MTGIPTAAEIEAAKAAVQAGLPEETRKQASSSAGDALGGAADVAGNVMVEGVGEVVVAAVGPVVEGVGTVAGAAVEGAAAVVVSIFEGLSS